MKNKIIKGGNLKVMGKLPDDSVDLVATDPPFCTGRSWGKFDDRWASRDRFISYMRKRAIEVKRVLKPTGSLYWHCDQRCNHLIRLMLEDVFGEDKFRNEIIWSYRRWSGKSTCYQRTHDCILFYSGNDNTWNCPMEPKADGTPKYKRWNEKVGDRFVTRCDKSIEVTQTSMRDVWDMPRLQSTTKERNGYPTQKPVALYERIIKASSAEGDLVLDPFCGSGTTCVAARNLGRDYLGIDSCQDAVDIARSRLQ